MVAVAAVEDNYFLVVHPKPPVAVPSFVGHTFAADLADHMTLDIQSQLGHPSWGDLV